MKRQGRRTLLSLVLVGWLWACVDDSVTRPTGPENDGGQAGPMLGSRTGILVPKPQMQARLGEIAHDVAIALADPAVRATVYAELRASPFREHKLHLASFLRGRGAAVVKGMAAARRATPEAVFAALDNIVDLEFYMPVPEHFAKWRGGPDVLVTSAMHDDGTAPLGFDLTGRPIQLSAKEPPAVPTLVITSVETDFSRVPSTSPEQSLTTTVPGAYAKKILVFDHEGYEGWTAGSPEFEIHTFVTFVINSQAHYFDVSCSGEEQTGLYRYDQDDGTWLGEVLLATEADLDFEQRVQFQMWENDVNPCEPAPVGLLPGPQAGPIAGRPPTTTAAKVAQLEQWSLTISRTWIKRTENNLKKLWHDGEHWFATAYNILGVATHIPRDDFVGLLVRHSGSWWCWPATGPAGFDIIAPPGGQTTSAGYATIDFRFGTRDPICPPPEEPPPPEDPPPPPPCGVPPCMDELRAPSPEQKLPDRGGVRR